MGLEDESESLADGIDLVGTGISEGLAEDMNFALLDLADCTDQCKQRGFSRPALAGHDHDLAGLDLQIVVVEHLFSCITCTEVMVDAADVDQRRPVKAAISFDTLGFKTPKQLAGRRPAGVGVVGVHIRLGVFVTHAYFRAVRRWKRRYTEIIPGWPGRGGLLDSPILRSDRE